MHYFLFELRKGRKRFDLVHLHVPDHDYFDVKWDGKYVALLSDETLYRIAVNGNRGTLQGQVNLRSQAWFWVVPEYAQVVSTDTNGAVYYSSYPGGYLMDTLQIGGFINALAVSLAHQPKV